LQQLVSLSLLAAWYKYKIRQVEYTVQGGPKKLHTAFFAITLQTLNRFS